MKTLKSLTFILIFSSLVNLCYAQKAKQENSIDHMISLYLDIKNALIINDGITVKNQSNKLYHVLSGSPFTGLTKDQGNLVGTYLGDLLDNTRQMCYTVNAKEQRPYFARLSTHLYDLLKDVNLNKIIIYKQYCPRNQAYWLSETPVIKNPYYTLSGYLSDGKTAEILAANK
jgi:hypothetical protein